jgi:hypothetical protein
MSSALKETISSMLGPDSPVWSYERDFDALWSLQQDAVDSFNGRQIILWSQTPPGNCYPVDTDLFVSPVVWAICAASRNPALKTHGVTIIDLSPDVHADDPLVDQINAFRQDSIPWLKFLRWRDLVVEDIESLRDVVLGITSGHSHSQSADSRAFDHLRQTLRFHLTDPSSPDKRHAVSNLVGPMILLGKVPSLLHHQENTNGIKSADHLAAFKTVLEVCELIPKTKKSPTSTSAKQLDESRRSCSLVNTRIILLDDQWHQGWGEWVCQTLGLEYHPVSSLSPMPQKVTNAGSVEVFVTSDPRWLVERLVLSDAEADKRLRLSLVDAPDNKSEILLLDVRLFSGDDDRETLFIGRLIQLCKRFTLGIHAWESFAQTELDDVESWCAGPGNSSNAPVTDRRDSVRIQSVARSLLGRLIALTDFSFPIVLFSSTGDRDMVRSLAQYGNIISSFSKPRTFSASQNFQAEEIAAALLRALTLARSVLDTREFLRTLSATSSQVRSKAEQFLQLADQSSSKCTHAELYVDETGQPVDHVGGCIMFYEDVKRGPKKAYVALRDENLIWGASREETQEDVKNRFDGTIATLLKAKDVDNQSLDQRMKKTCRTLNDVGPFAGCVLRIPNGGQPVSLPGGPDLRYREVAATLIELFLYDWLPVMADVAHRSLTAGVFVATRLWPPPDLTTLINCQWNFGCELQAHSVDPGKKGRVTNADVVALAAVPLEERSAVGYFPPPNDFTNCLVPAGSRGPIPDVQKRQVFGRTMGPSSAYEIVVGIARQRIQNANVVYASGVTLRDGPREHKDHGPLLPRQIHYASDDLMAVVRRPPVLQRWLHSRLLDSGFYATANEHVLTLLRASRAIDDEDRLPEAVSLLRTIWDDADLKAATNWVAARAANRFETMDGHDFMQICHLRGFETGAYSLYRSHVPPESLST